MALFKKAVKHPSNFGSLQQVKLKHNFWIFVFFILGFGYKDIQQIQKDIPRKSLFSQPWISRKSKGSTKIR